MLREYIISEAIHSLKIPTTRSLAVVKTGEKIVRENLLPGAILTRVASSHIRVGTFQYIAAKQNINDLNKHKFISFGKGAPSPVYNPEWALKLGALDGKKRKTVMKVNSVMGLLLAVETGVGLSLIHI